MDNRKAHYEQMLNDFKEQYGLTEEEFLRIYNLQGEELQREEEKLPKNLQAALIHLKVAYGLMLKELRGEE